jgi:hypothetical protein
MTSALRLSTVGSGVSEGRGVGVSEGAGVSVKGSVGVRETVGVVGAEGVNDSVGIGGMLVGEGATAGTEGVVRLQARDVSIRRIESARLRLIGKVCVPFRKGGSDLW